jgi:transposase-like protein
MSLRTRRTKEEIQRILRQYPTSGLSKRQFCNQYRLSEAALYKWIKINKIQNSGNFIPVAINSDINENKNYQLEISKNMSCYDLSMNEIKIEFPRGIIIKIPMNADPKCLSIIIKEVQ